MDELDNYRILAAAREFLERLLGTIRYSELFDGAYAVSSRLKKPARLQDKIVAKRNEGRPAYSLADVTDIIGVRFISLYRRDITQNVRSILELVAGEKAISPNSLQGVEVVELKSYTSNTIPDQDPVNLELRTLYEGSFSKRFDDVPFELIARSRYSSVHMVLKARYSHEGTNHVLPVELQFRSVFEDAWAEIDHKLLYELGRFGERVDGAQREAMAQHMSVLKKIVDTAADYADVIRRTVVVSREKPVTIERNLDDAEYILELAPLAGLPHDTTHALAIVLREKVALDRDIEEGRADISALQYVDVANKLSLLTPGVEAALGKNDTRPARTIAFSLRMEEALCRLLSGDPQQIRGSVESYAKLVRDFPQFPAGWFRSAQAHQRLSEIAEAPGDDERTAVEVAFAHFGKAMTTLDEHAELKDEERIFFISPAQANYIGVNTARLQGFTKWRLSDRRRRATTRVTLEDLKDVLLAFQVSRSALEREQEEADRIKLVNNVVFYAADAHEMAGALQEAGQDFDEVDLPEKTEMRALLKLLSSAAGDNILRLETIVRANLVVGDPTAAGDAARQILDLNADGSSSSADTMSSPYVAEAKERAARNAWKVVRAAGQA